MLSELGVRLSCSIERYTSGKGSSAAGLTVSNSKCWSSSAFGQCREHLPTSLHKAAIVKERNGFTLEGSIVAWLCRAHG